MATLDNQSDQNILNRLALPERPIRAILDTDTNNEIDDQFALSYALLNPSKLALEAIYAAPFLNVRAPSPGAGMEQSFAEILKVLDLLALPSTPPVFRGSDRFIASGVSPVESDAAHDLIERALTPREEPLYVISIGAPTNIASALQIAPKIADKIVVVWLGGHPVEHGADTREFNLSQDIEASRTLLDSRVPLIIVPCRQVAELLATTTAELNAYLKGRSALADYLCEIAGSYIDSRPGSSRPIWDLAALVILLRPELFESKIISSPLISDECTWVSTVSRHPIRIVTYLHRDEIMRSFFSTVGGT